MQSAITKAENRLEQYNHKTAKLSYGDMTYVDRGKGEVIVIAHGLFGGYDQATDSAKDLEKDYRIIAPSRFGYLGSDVKGKGTPKEQAEAYIELLDSLKIDKAYVLGTSAGGTPAIRFGLDYPERTKGILLYCSAAPWSEKPDPKDFPTLMGPPPVMNNDYPMWLLAPLFEPIMGMSPKVIDSMLPLSERAVGANLDASITNRDMAINFDEYPIEQLKPPVLLLHSKDDKVAPYSEPNGHVESSLHRYPNLTTKIFDTGGHMMVGHSDEINSTVNKFINDNTLDNS